MPYQLSKAVAKVAATPMSFGLYKGEDADQVLVSSAAPTPQLMQEMQKECGKVTQVLKGVCFREGEVLVFATKVAPAPQWKMQISKILKERKCQGVSKIDLRQLGPDESDVVGGEAAGDGTKTDGASKPKSASTTKPTATTKPTDARTTGTAKGPDAKTPKGLSAEWNAAREAAVRGVQNFVGKLKATGDADAAKAGDVVQNLAASFPAGLDTALAGFEKATAAKDAKAIAAARAQAKAYADTCLKYLKANQELISLCESNPFGAAVSISQPLTAALQSIAARIG